MASLLERAEAALAAFDERVERPRAALRAEKESRAARAARLEGELGELRADALLTDEAAAVLKRLVEVVARGGVAELEAMLSYGVRTIFEGRDYSVEIEVDDRGKDKTATMWLLEARPDAAARRTLLYDGNGGGLAAVASLMLRVFLICRFKRRRVVAMDEPMSELSKEFTDGFLAFLRLAVEELGFVFIMVTHDERFVGEADRVYRVEDGRYQLVKGGGDAAT